MMGLILWRAPMWKPEHRLAADRRGLRYPSDLTDAEWRWSRPWWTGCQWSRRKHGARSEDGDAVLRTRAWNLQIVKRSDAAI